MNTRIITTGLCVTALAAAAPGAQATPPAAPTITVMLDTYSESNSRPSVTTPVLPSGTYHFMTVSGTFTFFPRDLACGSPTQISYPSRVQRPQAKAAADAETLFATPSDPVTGACATDLPRHNGHLRVNTGDGYRHLEPIGGPVTVPNPEHTYTYLLTGQGANATIGVELLDNPTSDNAGQLKIEVRQASRSDCKDQSWQQFQVFANQGDCVSFFATSERNAPGTGQR